MHYYIISFHVYIDREDVGTLMIGRVSPTTDYQFDLLVDSIIGQYRKNYPGSKAVNIKLLETKEVSENQYNDELKKLVEINHDA